MDSCSWSGPRRWFLFRGSSSIIGWVREENFGPVPGDGQHVTSSCKGLLGDNLGYLNVTFLDFFGHIWARHEPDQVVRPWPSRNSKIGSGRSGLLTMHRCRAGGPVWPIIPGVFLRRYLARLSTYFDELNAVVQEIDHAFIYAKKASYERENFNVFSYHENPSLLAVWCVPGINEHVVTMLVTSFMSRLKSCEQGILFRFLTASQSPVGGTLRKWRGTLRDL